MSAFVIYSKGGDSSFKLRRGKYASEQASKFLDDCWEVGTTEPSPQISASHECVASISPPIRSEGVESHGFSGGMRSEPGRYIGIPNMRPCDTLNSKNY